jgi:molecular chaperone DnaK (HSP70)
VATVRSGQAETLADEQGRHLLPSVVHYQQQGHAVGYDARANAARDPANTISSVKRMMGRSLADIQTRYPHLPYQLQASENGLPMMRPRRSAEPDPRFCRHPQSAGGARYGDARRRSRRRGDHRSGLF